MRKAILLYNPFSGGKRSRRLADVKTALTTLRAAGIDASAAPTAGAGRAPEQVREAIAQGCDTVFACGGDGTIHDVLQGLVGTETALGIIPLGTANSVACDLGLPTPAAKAAMAAVNAHPRSVAVGQVEFRDFSGNLATRYFIFIVGVGVDAELFYKLNASMKRTFGMAAYCAKATWLWMTHGLGPFAVEIARDGCSRKEQVSQLLAVRIRDFGGALRELAPGAALDRNDFRAVLFHTRSRWVYLRYILRGLFGTAWNHPGIELVNSKAASCFALDQPAGAGPTRVFVEADGELLGTLPVKISMATEKLIILVPDGSRYASK
jgi:YegS/Rv2252/BmrU family lipid kinase